MTMRTFPPARVLYAEDSEDSCFMITTVMRFAGIEVITARKSADALRLAKTEYFDLYMMDTRFPDGCGFDLCRYLRGYAPDTPVVIYTADARAEDVEAGVAAGASAYLIKPYLRNMGETILQIIENTRKNLIQDEVSLSVTSRKYDYSIGPSSHLPQKTHIS